MGLLSRALRSLLEERPVMREQGSGFRSDLTLEKHHASTAADFAVVRQDLHTLAEEMRVLEQRSEQVFCWLANLQTDLHRALKGELSAVVEGLSARRALGRQVQGSGVGSDPREPALNPLTPRSDGEDF